MSCLSPILALDLGASFYTGKTHTFEDGKHLIRILPPARDKYYFEELRQKYGKALMLLPCGKCIACAQDYARTWQARIMCEAQYHQKSCFITTSVWSSP